MRDEGREEDEGPAPDEPAPEATDPYTPAGDGETQGSAAQGSAGEGSAPEDVTPETPPEEEQPAGSDEPEAPAPSRAPPEASAGQEDVIPGAHLEPDLVLEPEAAPSPYAEDAEPDYAGDPPDATAEAEDTGTVAAESRPARGPVELARDARYQATGKRKTSVARVILKPGDGSYTINGRALDEFFPRPALQKRARQALETVGYASRMDVVARIHGGGVSSQAGALRHGVARALVEADPNLRTDLKRRGFLTRDAREKERKKAGLKKARKRPQFSKR
jgi:small subunit ribosomal protein S9